MLRVISLLLLSFTTVRTNGVWRWVPVAGDCLKVGQCGHLNTSAHGSIIQDAQLECDNCNHNMSSMLVKWIMYICIV